MLAIISDIHSNVEALQAVLDDIDRRDVRAVYCLGDVVGYGPDPKACLDLLIERTEVTLLGNHDYAVLYEPNRFNIGAEAACFWTRRQLDDEPDARQRARRWEFLGSLPIKHVIEHDDEVASEVVLVHGSPRRPVNEYVFPDDIFTTPGKMQTAFDRFHRLCFMGHTHVPGVFLDMQAPDFYSPEELDDVYTVEADRKALINVGSVGQPRDGDPRASYVLLEPGAVRFVRVEYDADVTAEKVRAVSELDDFLGSRLLEGR
jgi:diadenosine tetraphosphatase ApaH/serine/threonine PP2A family protein phosphatase